MEEDVVDFPDELDTSFFARVKQKNIVIFEFFELFASLLTMYFSLCSF